MFDLQLQNTIVDQLALDQQQRQQIMFLLMLFCVALRETQHCKMFKSYICHSSAYESSSSHLQWHNKLNNTINTQLRIECWYIIIIIIITVYNKYRDIIIKIIWKTCVLMPKDALLNESVKWTFINIFIYNNTNTHWDVFIYLHLQIWTCIYPACALHNVENSETATNASVCSRHRDTAEWD